MRQREAASAGCRNTRPRFPIRRRAESSLTAWRVAGTYLESCATRGRGLRPLTAPVNASTRQRGPQSGSRSRRTARRGPSTRASTRGVRAPSTWRTCFRRFCGLACRSLAEPRHAPSTGQTLRNPRLCDERHRCGHRTPGSRAMAAAAEQMSETPTPGAGDPRIGSVKVGRAALTKRGTSSAPARQKIDIPGARLNTRVIKLLPSVGIYEVGARRG